MLVSRFPYPLDKGDKLRAFHQLVELNKRFDVTLVALSDSDISVENKNKLKNICFDLEILKFGYFSKIVNMLINLIGSKPIQVGYFYNRKAQKRINEIISNNNYNHLYCQLIRTSEYVKNVHHIPKTIDYMDALSKGIERRIKLQSIFKRWLFKLEAARLKKYERYIFDYFENHTIISDQDKKLIDHPERDNIICTSNGIDESFFEAKNHKKEFDFVFVGNMSYAPNIEAVQYIVNEILPKIPASTLLISGASPSSLIKKIAHDNDRIHLTGWVDDIRESYLKGEIFLAPMKIGTGMQNKLLESMALGIPCITTPLANNAINAINEKEILVGNDTEEIIGLIKKLKSNPQLYDSISVSAKNMVKSNFSWEKSIDKLSKLILSS